VAWHAAIDRGRVSPRLYHAKSQVVSTERRLTKRQFEELRLSAHRRWLNRRGYEEGVRTKRGFLPLRRDLYVEGRYAYVVCSGGAIVVRIPARALKDPQALSKRGF